MDLLQTVPESWYDFSVDRITVDYENIFVCLSNENKIVITCFEYIHFSSYAHWDENILKSISIVEKAPIIEKTLHLLRNKYSDSYLGGGTKKLTDKYICVRFEFLDDNIFEIVCKSYSVSEGEK